jgi:hypothetical protein
MSNIKSKLSDGAKICLMGGIATAAFGIGATVADGIVHAPDEAEQAGTTAVVVDAFVDSGIKWGVGAGAVAAGYEGVMTLKRNHARKHVDEKTPASSSEPK